MQENMNQNLLFKFHNNQFNKIEKDLERIYERFTNRKKIIVLLDSWLFFSFTLIHAYNAKEINKFIGDKNKVTSLLFFDDKLNNINNFDKKKVRFPLPLFFIGISTLLFNKIYLKAAFLKNFSDKFLYILDSLTFPSIALNRNSEMKSNIINILIKKYAQNNIELGKIIKSKLPDIFYSNPIFLIHNLRIICDGSAHSFMDFDGYEKILLLNNKLIIRGRQHGGGYGVYQDDIEIKYELKICDHFYGWGLLGNNTKQHKFEMKPIFDTSKKIVWVERAGVSKLFSMYSESAFKDFQNTRPIKYINKELSSKRKYVYNLIHRGRYCSLYENYRYRIINNAGKPGEFFIKKGNLVIFDNILGTLIYFCIFNNISFIIVTNRELSLNYSKKMKIWMNFLRKNNQLFFDDEKNALKRSINNYFTSND